MLMALPPVEPQFCVSTAPCSKRIASPSVTWTAPERRFASAVLASGMKTIRMWSILGFPNTCPVKAFPSMKAAGSHLTIWYGPAPTYSPLQNA
jgi:hypothetical protein